MKRKWVQPLLSITAVVVGWGLILLLLHKVHVDGLRRDDVLAMLNSRPNLPSSLLRKIGVFENRKDSSFVNFDRSKGPGVTRICALGDSFTHGDEVSASNDYPSFLQRRLDAEHPGVFEVLNFGQGWFGFHQTYLLWDEVGRFYECDVVLLGPSGFFPKRDTSFNHAQERNPYYLHARFVLEAGDVRLVEVIGDTAEERFEAYHRLVPHKSYLRYDAAVPAVLRSIVPGGFALENPFYYYDGTKGEEARETYRILLRKLAESGPRVLLGAGKRIINLVGDTPAIETFQPAWPSSFPYRAPRDHFGPLGNDLVAREFEQLLMPGDASAVPGLRIADLDGRGEDFSAAPPPPLHDLEAVHIALAFRRIGHFVSGETHLSRKGMPSRLRSDGVRALLLAGTPDRMRYTGSDGPLDGCFLELEQPMVDGTPVFLESESSRHRIGRVRLWHPELAVGELWLEDGARTRLRMMSDEYGGTFVLPPPYDEAARNPEETVRVAVGDEVILEGTRTDLGSTRDRCWVLRANARVWVDVDGLPGEGEVKIVGVRTDKRPLRAEIARFEKVSISPPHSEM